MYMWYHTVTCVLCECVVSDEWFTTVRLYRRTKPQRRWGRWWWRSNTHTHRWHSYCKWCNVSDLREFDSFTLNRSKLRQTTWLLLREHINTGASGDKQVNTHTHTRVLITHSCQWWFLTALWRWMKMKWRWDHRSSQTHSWCSQISIDIYKHTHTERLHPIGRGMWLWSVHTEPAAAGWATRASGGRRELA